MFVHAWHVHLLRYEFLQGWRGGRYGQESESDSDLDDIAARHATHYLRMVFALSRMCTRVSVDSFVCVALEGLRFRFTFSYRKKENRLKRMRLLDCYSCVSVGAYWPMRYCARTHTRKWARISPQVLYLILFRFTSKCTALSRLTFFLAL